MKTLDGLDESEKRDLVNLCAFSIRLACEYMNVEKPNFSLLLYRHPAVAAHITNGDQGDAIAAMQHTANRLGQEEYRG